MEQKKYQIVVQNEIWKYISDGTLTFFSTYDLRRAGKPPFQILENNELKHLVRDGLIDSKTAFDEFVKDYNRISISSNSISDLVKMNKIENRDIHNQQSILSIIKKGLKYSVIFGSIGFALGGVSQKHSQVYQSALLAAGILWGFYVGLWSEYKKKDISLLFDQLKLLSEEWIIFEDRFLLYIESLNKNYTASAKALWNKYHKYKFIFENTDISQLDNLSGLEFEVYVQQLFIKKGYSVELTKRSNDYGVDLIAKRKDEIIAIQTKRYNRTVGVDAVQEVSSGAKFYNATKGIVVTNSIFSKNAVQLSKNIGIELIDRTKLSAMIYSLDSGEKKNAEFDGNKFEEMKREIKRYLYVNKL